MNLFFTIVFGVIVAMIGLPLLCTAVFAAGVGLVTFINWIHDRALARKAMKAEKEGYLTEKESEDFLNR